MRKDLQMFWEQVNSIMENEAKSIVSYECYLKTLEPVDVFEGKLVILAPTSVTLKTVNEHYYDMVLNAVLTVNPQLDGITLMSASQVSEFLKKHLNFENANFEKESDDKIGMDFEKAMFDKKYTFENFVVGKSNQMVYAASQNVAANPGESYNPLFIYGGSGLGKTHLMHAIGNELLQSRPNLRVFYTTSERFFNELVDAIKGGNIRGKNLSTKSFREKYRTLDVLMIDDIQFIENKVSAQEEFFHTFNELYQNKKQIIISSDRAPKYLMELQDRLRTRFQWGMTCDIAPPELETRLAILKKKAEHEKAVIDADVLAFIAEKIPTNIREMEGVLSRVTFYAGLLGKTRVNMEIALEALKDYVEDKQDRLSIDTICDHVCDFYEVTKDDMISKKKTKTIATARMVCIYLITDILAMPLAAIGAALGGRDHTTIIHSRDKIAESLKTENAVSLAVKDIRAKLFKK